MKKKVIALLILITTSSFAQDLDFIRPDYNAIKKQVLDTSSIYFYPKLMKKFNSADFTMTLDEKRHLYYGFVFQSDYDTEYITKSRTKFIEIIQKKELNETDYDELIIYGDSILKKDPMDIRILNYLNLIFEKKGLTNRMISSSAQIRIITNAILSSGTGLTEESPIYVINISHEYDILNILGFEFGGSQSLIKTNDYLTVKENIDKIKGLFFEISPRLTKLNIGTPTTFKKEDLIGTWKVTNIIEKFKNKNLIELVKGFEASTFIFNSDNTFHFKSTDKSRGILEFLKMMGTSNWIYDYNKNLIRIGTKKDHYTLMGFKFIQKDNKTFFITEDNGIYLTFEVEKK